jgi:hypothetical protein
MEMSIRSLMDEATIIFMDDGFNNFYGWCLNHFSIFRIVANWIHFPPGWYQLYLRFQLNSLAFHQGWCYWRKSTFKSLFIFRVFPVQHWEQSGSDGIWKFAESDFFDNLIILFWVKQLGNKHWGGMFDLS